MGGYGEKGKKRPDLDKIEMSICLGCNGNGFLLEAPNRRKVCEKCKGFGFVVKEPGKRE
jgi:DnaJ-class molecular chaperone